QRLADLLASDRPVTVLFLDLDDFKVVNDAAGHLVGDTLLTMLGRRLSRALGSDHLLTRFGGDEFVVVCRDLPEDRAVALARRLHDAVRPPFEVSGGRFYVSASIGIASDRATSPARTGAEELVSRADTAMYDAKSRGRNRTSVFDEAMAARVRDVLELTNDLREALERGQLELWYQPVVELATGAVMGLEALARWNHPRRGPVPPDVFVPIAEHSGLVTALDRWAVRRAGQDAAALRAAGVLAPTSRMAVNVSAKAVTDGLLPSLVLEATPPEELRHLVLEITETGVMSDPEQARVELEALHAHGVRVAIDDFGIGQSSLSYLQRFPVSVLKVDRSFVLGMTTSADDRAIVRSVLSLAQDTGLVAVAEGVEDEAQRQALLDLGCPLAQGYLWSPALPLPRLVAWLTAQDRLVSP
ncbi:MAG: putative bifunctional diguanylate cyclase/phosphodiesterase, partial [Mycobacteriales bacterium]